MNPEFWFVVYVFAVYRLSELISHDQIFDAVRRGTGRRAAAGNKVWKAIADWMRCPLCIGIWVSFPAAFLFSSMLFKANELQYVLTVWLGMAGAQYLLSSLTLDKEDN
jgi:hypothetical protein